MEEDCWSFGLSSASSRSFQSTLKSHPDFFIEIDEFDGDDDLRLEFPCPFCSEDFDLLGLCCHIDEEHPSETNSGVCPVCATRISTNMVGHITTHHVNFFKGNQKLKSRKDEFFSNLSLNRKELQDEHFRTIFGGSSSIASPVSTSTTTLDPLLSFLHNTHATKSKKLEPTSSSEMSFDKVLESSEQKAVESDNRSPVLSGKDQEEKAQRCKFVQGLVLSTIFDDDL